MTGSSGNSPASIVPRLCLWQHKTPLSIQEWSKVKRISWELKNILHNNALKSYSYLMQFSVQRLQLGCHCGLLDDVNGALSMNEIFTHIYGKHVWKSSQKYPVDTAEGGTAFRMISSQCNWSQFASPECKFSSSAH